MEDFFEVGLRERKATLGVAALGNEAASDAGKVSMLKTLGEFAIKLFK